MNDPPAYRLVLVPVPDPHGRPVTVRLRALLKLVLRWLCFRCVSITPCDKAGRFFPDQRPEDPAGNSGGG